MPVAEFTIGLILSTLRFQALGHERAAPGPLDAFNQMPGETFCIVRQHRRDRRLRRHRAGVAKRCTASAARILYTQRTRLPAAEEQALGVELRDAARLACDRRTSSRLHCPLTPETTNLIDTRGARAHEAQRDPDQRRARRRRGRSRSRGALRGRAIRGAAMDVYSIEPLPADSELLKLDNIVVTPHLAAATADTFEPTVRRMFDNMARVTRGEPVPEGDLVV